MKAETLSEYACGYTNEGYTGATAYYGSSLVLKSGTDIKHYFTPAPSISVENYTCKDSNGNIYEVVASGSYIYVRVLNILAHNLGNNVALTLYENDTAVGTISYSPMSYAYAVLSKYGAGEKDTLRNVAIALYDYYENAKAYRAA